MLAKPTYRLPPDFSAAPPPDGPYDLGSVLRDYDKHEQVGLLNEGETRTVALPKVYHNHKGGFTATRSRMKSGELGLWAKYMDLWDIGLQAGVLWERGAEDEFSFDSLDTQYFKPDNQYVSDCLQLPDVADYLEGCGYREAVYLVTGLKIAKGANICVGTSRNIEANLALGGRAAKIELRGKRAVGDSHAFTESSDIVVGIQCKKIYHERSGFLGILGKRDKVQSKTITDGAVFYGEGAPSEKRHAFFGLEPMDYATGDLEIRSEGDETWLVPKS